MKILLSMITIGILAFCATGILAAEDPNATAVEPEKLYQEAVSYLRGRDGKERSPQEAATRFRILADQGWSPAQYMLARLYLKGDGVEQNQEEAYYWFANAARRNFKPAETELLALRGSMPTGTVQALDIRIGYAATKRNTETLRQ